ncbi:transmembrane protein, putative (macronuclear) [Tetrahymena thermophila SB210]|uniref:Transmembrane protein, putative n=1 Tax=Tetrahymena thermophila (strain SB210) TaxID=312017 RepID=W7X6E4_TETTS|nr:transmembrane protein, putative [Tetrahymena thermophila SB210]EWS71923.1 transmembrane protein, putative [Tetrahymena thermophila SB210]|eukprot:XP_012655552.1 transmembrane protein, putative [Tetrahymena thermophila SB210]
MKQKIKKASFLQLLDMFGVGVNMKINSQDLYKTRIGGIFTIMLILVMIIFSANLFQQVLYKQNPNLLFQQQQISQPYRHDIDASNFSLAVTLLDEQTLLPIYDESIFTISAQVFYKNNIKNQDGTSYVESGTIDLVMERCTENDFQEPESRSYFMQLDFSKMYCIKPGQSGMFLEGQFDADRFNMVRININECISTNCKDPTTRQNILSNTDLQVYYTNSVVQITNLKKPFKRVGQTQFWKTNYNMVQQVNLMFINQFVQDDMGLFYSEDLETENDLAFSSERILLGSRQASQDAPFYQIEIYMEKNSQNIYKRTYIKFPQAVSQIGGIFNVIFALGCLFTKPYAKYQLQKKIIKHSFNFSEGQASKTKKKLGDNSNLVQNKKLQLKNDSSKKLDHKIELQNNILKKQNESIQQQTKGFFETQSFKLEKSHNMNTFNNNDTQLIFQQSFNQKPQFKESTKGKGKQIDAASADKVIKENDEFIIENIQKNDLEIQNKSFFLKISSMFIKGIQNYLKSYTVFFNICKYVEFNFCVSKINQFTDVCTIINKQIELQRIKFILLNYDQISAFNQIPQPIVSEHVIKMDPSISLFALNMIEDNENEFLHKSALQSQLKQTQKYDTNIGKKNIILKKEYKNNPNQKILQMINLDHQQQNIKEQIYSEEKIEQSISKNESIFKIANTNFSQNTQIKKNSNLLSFNNKISSSQISESIIIESFNISPQQVYQSKDTPIIPHLISSKFNEKKLHFKSDEQLD